jgi:hypothetical protein
MHIHSTKNYTSIDRGGPQREFNSRTAMQTNTGGCDDLIDGALFNHAGILSGSSVNYS